METFIVGFALAAAAGGSLVLLVCLAGKRTELVKAFVVLAAGFEPNEALAESLKQLVRQHLAKHEVPRLIEFVTALPMTTTGKIMRRALRDQEIATLQN